VAQHENRKREQRLVKALRDNLRRRKPALHQSAKAAVDGEVAPDPTVKGESKRTS
jgi:hypothetical protein